MLNRARIFAAALVLCAATVRADTISFSVVAPPNYNNTSAVAATLHAQVHDLTIAGKYAVAFDFYSTGTASNALSMIDSIYFHDGPFIDPKTASITWISTSGGGSVSWAAGANPSHLPGEPDNWVDATFNSQDTSGNNTGINTYTGSLSAWDGTTFANPAIANSYQGDYVQLTFLYTDQTTPATVATLASAFGTGAFNVGFHVQSEGGGSKSDAFIGSTWTPPGGPGTNAPPPAPLPTTVAMGMVLLSGFGAYRVQRLCRKAS
jgi:hypothetical protein